MLLYGIRNVSIFKSSQLLIHRGIEISTISSQQFTKQIHQSIYPHIFKFGEINLWIFFSLQIYHMELSEVKVKYTSHSLNFNWIGSMVE